MKINAAKIVLADEVTKLVRGEDAAASARATAEQTFTGGGLGEDLPVLLIPADGVRAGAALTELGFTASNGEAKRKIAEGAVKLDGQLVDDPAMLIAPPTGGKELRLSLGKKRHAILRAS